ncbi:hypothetical protein R1flu_009880 [Riccia fluitans]|uniref:Uncharacterized protein n=1 Tax=Riccia fluitans TaxID=41844 RepID=A0ABD1Z3H5_9MARC
MALTSWNKERMGASCHSAFMCSNGSHISKGLLKKLPSNKLLPKILQPVRSTTEWGSAKIIPELRSRETSRKVRIPSLTISCFPLWPTFFTSVVGKDPNGWVCFNFRSAIISLIPLRLPSDRLKWLFWWLSGIRDP